MNYINNMEIQNRHIQCVVMEGLIIGSIIHTDDGRMKITDYIKWKKKTDEFILAAHNLDTNEYKIAVFQDTVEWKIELPEKAVPNYEIIRTKRK